MSNAQPFFLYILFSPSSDKYYVGQTKDLQQRLLTHNSEEAVYFNLNFKAQAATQLKNWQVFKTYQV